MPNLPDTYTEKDGLTTGSNGEALGDNKYFFTDLNIGLQSGEPIGYIFIPMGAGEYTGRKQEEQFGVLDDEEVPEMDEREIGKMMSDIDTIKGNTNAIQKDVSDLKEGMARVKVHVDHILTASATTVFFFCQRSRTKIN